MSKSIEVGAKLGGYILDRKEPLENLQGTFFQLTHIVTGARHIHIEAPDDNNLFSVIFPTVPKDSTGVAHILEHIALSGSERFRVHDMFKSMSTRSLKTFMNASTSPDSTQYYYSTRNTKDYFNLMDVYLDAAFFPLLEELAFKQEGHRLEFETPGDAGSELGFKGVVFNEMKGQMATPSYAMIRALGRALYPDLTYANNSGGDPEFILDLTWENLKAFHAKHYHPSNSYFFTYGDIPLEKNLEWIERVALSKFQKSEVDTGVPDQKRFEAPREYEAKYPLAKEEDATKKSQVLISWATTHLGNSFEVFALDVLEEALIGNPAAPLRKALIDSGLGEDLADLSGFASFYREPVFSAGLKGIRKEDAEAVEKIVLETLTKLAGEGVDQTQIDAAIHQREIRARQISNAGGPYALHLFSQLKGAYMYEGDPYKALRFDDDLAQLQAERAAGPFFENLIRRFLLDNPHRVRILLVPDQDLEQNRKEIERTRLEKVRTSLSKSDIAKIVEDSLALKKSQDSKQDLSSLPTLELDDVPMRFEDIGHEIEQIGGARVGFFPLPTNGLSYVSFRFSFEGLADRLKDTLPLFEYAVTRSGAGDDDYLRMAARIEASTGGVSAGASARTLASQDGFIQNFTFGGKALTRNHEPFLKICKDILASVKFEPSRLKDLINEYKARMESSVVQAGHLYSYMLASSTLTGEGALNERLSGLGSLSTIKALSKLDGPALQRVIDDLNGIKDHLFRNAELQICITTEEKNIPELRKLVEEVLGALPGDAAQAEAAQSGPPTAGNMARTTSVPVAYNAKALKVAAFTSKDAPALMVLSRLLDAKYLHREIREKGGAYGGFSTYNRETGTFALLSYRDPHIVRTFEVFDGALKFVESNEWGHEDLKEGILVGCGAVDPLTSPDTKGRIRFFDDLAGYTLEAKAKFKAGLLKVTADDVRRVARTYLGGDGASLATISSVEKVEEANKELGGIFAEVKPV